MDLNQLRNLEKLPHLSAFTVEELYSELPLYERVLISTCDVVCKGAAFEGDIPQVCVSKDVQCLHDFCQRKDPVMLPCCECGQDQAFSQEAAWDPNKIAADNRIGRIATKRSLATELPTSHQLDQMTGKSNPPERPFYRFGNSHLADVDSSQFQGVSWDIFREECGHQCKKEILAAAGEFRKDICCKFNSRHRGFVDFVIVPAVSDKPRELVVYEERKASEEARFAGAEVVQTKAEREAEELYNKYCRDVCLMKVGQYPALKDMQLFDTRKYRKILKDDYRYYTLSIALAGEGVGIGAFTYLRRIFENMVEEVHQQCVAECNEKVKAGQDDTEEGSDSAAFDESTYQSLRFNEKIAYLEDNYHRMIIPYEVESVRNTLYGVISQGIHQSSEEECLELYHSVRFIIEAFLDEKIQREERQKKLDAAMKKIQGKGR